MGTKKIMLIIVIILAIGLVACERPASKAPVSSAATETSEAENLGLFAEPEMATALAIGASTQTAIALQAKGISGDEGPTNTPGAPEATEGPAIAELTFPTATATPSPQPVSTETVPETYVLQEGEFPYCIARRFNVNPDDLLNLNGLSRGQNVYPGTKLKIPQTGRTFPGERALLAHPTSYTVVGGDTLYIIACKFGDVTPLAIAQANGLEVDAELTVGQTLQIP
jgi:LysM repeat protein